MKNKKKDANKSDRSSDVDKSSAKKRKSSAKKSAGKKLSTLPENGKKAVKVRKGRSVLFRSELPAAKSEPKITKLETLQRTKSMLQREWNLGSPPVSSMNLRNAPPGSLGKSSLQIRALEGPIETNDFADVEAAVTGDELEGAETVDELRTVIWEGIPSSHKNS